MSAPEPNSPITSDESKVSPADIELPNGVTVRMDGSSESGEIKRDDATTRLNESSQSDKPSPPALINQITKSNGPTGRQPSSIAMKQLDAETNNDFEYEEDCDSSMKRCGCGSFRPDWLQRFRTPIVFLINYSLMGILRGAYFHYTISSLSTIEKRYAFPSRLSSIILIADNVSSMIINPLVGYLGEFVRFCCCLVVYISNARL